MKKLIKSVIAPISREAFLEWLESDSGVPLQIKAKGKLFENIMIISLPKTEQVTYLFCDAQYYKHSEINQDHKFTFLGLYLRQDHSIHLTNTGYWFEYAMSGLAETEHMSKNIMQDIFCKQVNRRVEELIANNRRNLEVSELSNDEHKRHLKYYMESVADSEAIHMFFHEENPDFRFHASFSLRDWSEDSMLDYLQAPDALIEKEAKKYIKDNQEQMLLTFLENDVLSNAYEALLQDADNPIHRMRSISKAVDHCGAKTVTVTVVKPEGTLTFKTEAFSLVGSKSYYSKYSITAQDRRKFEQLFGRNANYNANEITQITYGKKTIYRAVDAFAEDPKQDGKVE